jgi:predicted nucleic acid-binding protein
MRILIDTNLWISALISLSMRKRLEKINDFESLIPWPIYTYEC